MLCQHQAINYVTRTFSLTNTLLTLPKRPAWLAHLLVFLHCPWQWFVLWTSPSPFTLKLHSYSWQPIQRMLTCMLNALLLSFPQRCLRAFITGTINLESTSSSSPCSGPPSSSRFAGRQPAVTNAPSHWFKDSCASVIATQCSLLATLIQSSLSSKLGL